MINGFASTTLKTGLSLWISSLSQASSPLSLRLTLLSTPSSGSAGSLSLWECWSSYVKRRASHCFIYNVLCIALLESGLHIWLLFFCTGRSLLIWEVGLSGATSTSSRLRATMGELCGTCFSLITFKIMDQLVWTTALGGYIYIYLGMVSGCGLPALPHYSLHPSRIYQKQNPWMDRDLCALLRQRTDCFHHGTCQQLALPDS